MNPKSEIKPFSTNKNAFLSVGKTFISFPERKSIDVSLT